MIDKKGLSQFVSSLMDSGYKVIAPKRVRGRTFYSVLGTSQEWAEFTGGYSNAQNSPKDFLFPRMERILKFEGDGEFTDVFPEEGKYVFLGVRPCDAMAIKRLDSIFYWDYVDIYYKRKRVSSVIIGLACTDPSSSCFCTSLGIGPHDKKNVDIMFTKIEDDLYLAEAITEIGVNLISRLLFGAAATNSHIEKAVEVEKRAEEKIEKRLDTDEIFKVLDENFDSVYWEIAARKCIGCGICTYLCPTCHCFDIQDERSSRIRLWDSCQFALYSKHSTGYNPRNKQYKRFRNKVYHKFVYFKKNLDEYLCVGCGRCGTYCPMKINIFKVVAEANVWILERGDGLK